MTRSWIAAVVLCVGCGDDGGGGEVASSTTDAQQSSDSTSSGSGTASTSGPSSSTAESGEESSSTGATSRCWDDLEVGDVEVLYDGFADGSEGIAFGSDGRLVVTTIDGSVGTLWDVSAEGTATAFAEVPYALGLTPMAEGGFVVASIGELMEPDGGVYSVSSSGQTSLLAEGIDSPNFVVVAADGSVLVSDDFDTRVFRVGMDGAVSTVIEDVSSPNGIAFSPDGSAFYVASTFSSRGELTRYDVGDDGLPIESTGVEILNTGSGAFNDGIAVDVNGDVYVLANLRGEMWRVDGDATVLQDGEVVVDTLESPASLAFGRGEGFDPCSAYVTELRGTRVVRVALGVEGAPVHG